jgi:hypothetical protein
LVNVGHASSLEWAQKEVRLTAREGDDKVEASYPVKNTGSQIVKVTSIETGCGCTSARLTQTRLLPGAKDDLRVTFKLEGRVGSQSKLITIKTDESDHEPTQLWLKVDIISPVVVQPRMVFWRAGDPTEPKAVEVVLTPGEEVKLGEATCDTGDFTTSWEKAKTPGVARLLIKPANTTKPTTTQIHLNIFVKDVRKVITLYAIVR